MRRTVLSWGLGLLAFAAGTPGDAETPGETGLPPAECVRLLRAAWVAHLNEDPATELETLRSAFRAFPGEIAPTHALLEYGRQHGLADEERRDLEAELSRRLADLEHPLPVAILQWLARDPALDPEILRRLAGAVARRLEAPGDDVDLLLELLADVQLRRDRKAEAADALQRLWERTADPRRAWKLFWLELELERWPEVLELLGSVEELATLYWTTHVRALVETGRLDQALAMFDRHAPPPEPVAATAAAGEAPAEAVETLPFASRFTWLEELAWRFRDAGRDAEAEALFRRALAADPDNPEIAAVLLHFYAGEDERRVHAAAIARSWEQETDPQALLAEGTERLAAGDAEGAVALLARAAPSFPRLEAPWFNLGMAAYGLERWAQAAEALGRAAELNPERSASFFFRGVALMHLERCAEAVTALERALELDPERNQSHYYLTHCYRSLGRPEDAERHRRLYEASRAQ